MRYLKCNFGNGSHKFVRGKISQNIVNLIQTLQLILNSLFLLKGKNISCQCTMCTLFTQSSRSAPRSPKAWHSYFEVLFKWLKQLYVYYSTSANSFKSIIGTPIITITTSNCNRVHVSKLEPGLSVRNSLHNN